MWKKRFLQKTSSFHPSSSALPGMALFSARQERILLLSSTDGVKRSTEVVALSPPLLSSSLAERIWWPPFHQLSTAAGREPLDEQISSTSLLADSGRSGGWIVTSRGFTARTGRYHLPPTRLTAHEGMNRSVPQSAVTSDLMWSLKVNTPHKY